MKIGITGATGFIGRRIVELTRRGAGVGSRGSGETSAPFPVEEIRVFTRNAPAAERSLASTGGAAAAERRGAVEVRIIEWDCAAGLPPAGALAGLDAILHLAGENVAARRWNAAQKEKLRESRVLSTRHLIEGIKSESRRPRVLVCASAIGYYGPRGDEDMTEDSPPGSDFLADVCVDWEAEARRAEVHGVREVRVRVGIVLGAGGGALAKMLLPFKLFAGGPVGSGEQWMSWIHLDDIARLFLFAAAQESVRGPLNGTAPRPVRNREFARTLGKVLGRPAFLPAPAFGLRLLVGEFANVLVTGQRVLPARALALGFEFECPELEPALRQILRPGTAAPERTVVAQH